MSSSQPLFQRPEGPPPLVLAAVGLLALLFLSGAVYLLATLTLNRPMQAKLVEVGARAAVLSPYRGSIWKLEKARRAVKASLEKNGIRAGEAVTVFAEAPGHMRPLALTCQVGYLLPAVPRAGLALPAPLKMQTLNPGYCLVVQVKGRGNFTGNRAYRAAALVAASQGWRLGTRERYEVKIRRDGQDYVQHWFPVSP